MQDAWRAYLELALGVTEASRKKAGKVAKRLVGKGGATAAQLQALTEELVQSGLANREAMTKLVRGEVERALNRMGLANADEVAGLKARVKDLETELSDARDRLAVAEAAASARATATSVRDTTSMPDVTGAAAVPGGATTAASTADQVAAKKAVATKAVANKAVAKKTVAKKAVAKKAVAKQTAAKKAVAKKSVAKKTVAKRTGNDAAGQP